MSLTATWVIAARARLFSGSFRSARAAFWYAFSSSPLPYACSLCCASLFGPAQETASEPATTSPTKNRDRNLGTFMIPSVSLQYRQLVSYLYVWIHLG